MDNTRDDRYTAAPRYPRFNTADAPYSRGRSPARSRDDHRRSHWSPSPSHQQREKPRRPLHHEGADRHFSPERRYSAYADSMSAPPVYRYHSRDDISPFEDRDRQRGERYYTRHSPSPQRPHSRHVHFAEHQRSGNGW